MNKDLEWIRNYIFGDEKHEPMVTYIPYMMEVDRHINAVKAELAQQKALLDEAVKVIKIAEHISDEDEADIVMDYAKAFIEKEKNGN